MYNDFDRFVWDEDSTEEMAVEEQDEGKNIFAELFPQDTPGPVPATAPTDASPQPIQNNADQVPRNGAIQAGFPVPKPGLQKEGEPGPRVPLENRTPDEIAKAEKKERLGADAFTRASLKQAAEVLGIRGAGTEQITNAINREIQNLKSDDPGVRGSAEQTLKRVGLQAVRPLLLEMAKGDNLEVQRTGARILSHLCGPQTFFGAAHALRDRIDNLPNLERKARGPAGETILPFDSERNNLIQTDLSRLFPDAEVARVRAFRQVADQVKRELGDRAGVPQRVHDALKGIYAADNLRYHVPHALRQLEADRQFERVD